MNQPQKKILLVITGSIAAVKVPEIIRGLRDRQIEVRCVLTKSAQQFITPLVCASLSGNKVYDELFSLTDETEMGHIALARTHDAILVAPASANILAKMAHGLADDLASTLLLAADVPIFVAPAMNVKMWENKAVQRNITQLSENGIRFIGPDVGDLACGEMGHGRMSEPQEIIDTVLAHFKLATNKPLSGVKVLVTSGPTVEPIDPVRFISNRSSGKQGYAIASAMAAAGAEVTLVAGPNNLKSPTGVKVLSVESATQMLQACKKTLPVEVAVCAAAVADWSVQQVSGKKLKKKDIGAHFSLMFDENPDILSTIARMPKRERPELVIGFAAETEHVIENARVKLEQKQCDWVVANDVSDSKVFNDEDNTVMLISKHNEEHWPRLSKKAVAERLVQKIATHLQEKGIA